MDRLYCSIDEVVGWGVKSENELLGFVRSASEFIERKIGAFIPETESRRFDGFGGVDLWVGELLAVTSILDDADTLQASDYLLYPRQRLWDNGPYDRITLDPDATTIGAWSLEEDIIVVTGRWGLYEQSEATGATVQDDPLSDSATSLLANNGSKIRPGKVLLVDAEQLLVTATAAATASTATLNGALDANSEEVAVSDGSQLNIGEIAKVEFEKMLVLDISGNTLLVDRGWDNTKRTTHADTTAVNVHRTFTVKRAINGTTANSHAQGTDIYQYLPPYDVNYLCKQTASLMSRKEDTGYAGKTGSIDLGEVFYHVDFPEDLLKKIKSFYFVPVT